MTFWSLVHISLHSSSNPDPVTLKATLGIQPGKESCKSNKVDSSIGASVTCFHESGSHEKITSGRNINDKTSFRVHSRSETFVVPEHV